MRATCFAHLNLPDLMLVITKISAFFFTDMKERERERERALLTTSTPLCSRSVYWSPDRQGAGLWGRRRLVCALYWG